MSAKDDYFAVIDRIADHEPRCGYHDISQIELTDADVGVVLKYEPDVLSDALTPVSVEMADCMERAYALGTPSGIEAMLGQMLRKQLKEAATRMVLVDVQFECSTKRAIERANAFSSILNTHFVRK